MQSQPSPEESRDSERDETTCSRASAVSQHMYRIALLDHLGLLNESRSDQSALSPHNVSCDTGRVAHARKRCSANHRIVSRHDCIDP